MNHVYLDRPQKDKPYWVLLPGLSIDSIRPKDLVETEWFNTHWQTIGSNYNFISPWYMEVPKID